MEKSFNPSRPFNMKTLQNDMYDTVVDGVIVRDVPARIAYVANETERDLFSDQQAGMFVATYGITKLWQLKPDGTWATIYEQS